MFPKSLASLKDAYNVIHSYGLNGIDLSGGTAEGLAAFLFTPGMPLWSAWDLAERIREYESCVVEHLARGEDYDASLREDARRAFDILQSHDDKRRQLADYIRSVKFAAHGAAVWTTIAKLATTAVDERDTVMQSIRALEGRIVEVLAEIDSHSDLLGAPPEYTPGQDSLLDLLIRKDIERIDVSLGNAEPWDGKEEESGYELEALFALSGREQDTKPEALRLQLVRS